MIFICFCFRVSNSEKNWNLKKVRREDFIVALLFIFHSTSAVLLWTMMTTTPTCCCSMGTTAVECDSEISSFCSFCFFLVPCPALITVGSGEWPDAPVRSDPAPALIYYCTALYYDPHIIYNRLLYTNYTHDSAQLQNIKYLPNYIKLHNITNTKHYTLYKTLQTLVNT